MATSSAFYRLSEELLTMIIESVEDCYMSQYNTLWTRKNLDVLQALRIVHPRLAYNKALMPKLFRRLGLDTGKKSVSSLRTMEWKNLAPYINSIWFSSPDAKDRSEVEKTCASNQEVEAVWISTLQKLPHVHSFVVDAIREEYLSRDSPEPFVAERGDELLQLVVTTWRKTGEKPEELRFERDFALAGDDNTISLDECHKIDWANLRRFEWPIGAQVVTGLDGVDNDAHDKRVEYVGAFISTILEGTAPSLAHLELEGPFGFTWSPPSNTAYRQLEHIHIGHIGLGDSFNHWLQTCTSLKHLQLCCVGGIGMGTFLVIRKLHPLQIVFEQVICNEAMEESLSHYTGDEVDYTYRPEALEYYYEDANDALKAFLSGAPEPSPTLLEMWNCQDFEMPEE